jgi:hypothetical protein
MSFKEKNRGNLQGKTVLVEWSDMHEILRI